MDFLQLEYFCAVVHAGNITRAANALMISQPSLSQTISKLEGHLGTVLFERLPRGMALTEAGKRFYAYAARTLQDRRDILSAMRDSKAEVSGEIRVKCNAISYVVAQMFLAFQKLYPAVTIRFMSDSDLQGAQAKDVLRHVDLLISTRPSTRAQSALLVTEELHAALPPDHPLRDRESIALQELAEEDFLLYKEGEMRNIVENYCQMAGFAPKVLMECTNTNTMFSLTSSGMGVMLCPRSWRSMYHGLITIVPISEPRCSRTIRLLWAKDKYLNRAVSLFRDYLIENISFIEDFY